MRGPRTLQDDPLTREPQDARRHALFEQDFERRHPDHRAHVRGLYEARARRLFRQMDSNPVVVLERMRQLLPADRSNVGTWEQSAALAAEQYGMQYFPTAAQQQPGGRDPQGGPPKRRHST